MSKNSQPTASHDWLSSFLETLRRLPSIRSIPEIISLAKTKGAVLTWDEVYGLSVRSHWGASIVVPPFVTKFLGEYVREKNPTSILDPWVGVGSLLLPITEATKAQQVLGIGQNIEEMQVARAMAKGTPPTVDHRRSMGSTGSSGNI